MSFYLETDSFRLPEKEETETEKLRRRVEVLTHALYWSEERLSEEGVKCDGDGCCPICRALKDSP